MRQNTEYFRREIVSLGFEVKPGTHPIVPVMFGDAVRATNFAAALLKEGINVIAFSYPVVPLGQARIRVQISAAHSKEDLDFALEGFKKVRDQHGG